MNKNESKGKNTIIPHGEPRNLIPLDRLWPDLPRGRGVNSIGGELDVDGPASNQTRFALATVTPLLRWLSTKHNLIDLAMKAFSCKRIENTSKKTVNTQSEITDVN